MSAVDWEQVEEARGVALALGLPNVMTALQRHTADEGGRRVLILTQGIDTFLRSKARDGSSRETVSGYRKLLGILARDFGDRRIDLILPSEMASFLAQWRQPNTLCSYWRLAFHFFGWTAAMGYRQSNPVSRAMPRPVPTGGGGCYFTAKEARFILRQTMDTDEIGFWVLALFSGMRIVEIRRLQREAEPWRWFRVEDGIIDIPACAGKMRARRAAMHPVLTAWLQWMRQSERPFRPQNLLKGVRGLRRQVVARRLGVKVAIVPKRYNRLGYFNMARRAFISHALKLPGASYQEIAQRAGTSESMVRKYYRRPVTKQQAREYFYLIPNRI
ncbi:MAG: hypothetical protein KA257_00175 [Opitutaceae bacterium]|nr:hypothetical protein [Opitutaceae bacterium]